MVDKVQMDRDFRVFFRLQGTMEIDDLGIINVNGDVLAREEFPGPHLPLQFGVIKGDMDLQFQPHLKDLQGAPSEVGGTFRVRAENLTHLTGAPHKVNGTCKISSMHLQSLEHLPEHVWQMRLTITHTLPLLRLTEKSYPVTWAYPVAQGGSNDPRNSAATAIIAKYMDTGKAGALKAAAELIRAGCKENARW
jgi:hypothetical protein